MTDQEFIHFVGDLFAGSPRPKHFTDYTHCSECLEHDETLRAYTVETLTLEPISHWGWDPICFINPEGFRYYFPALVRLALTPQVSVREDSYRSLLLFHLSYTDDRMRHFSLFTLRQKEAVLALLRHIQAHHQETIALEDDEETLATAIQQWEDVIAGRHI